MIVFILPGSEVRTVGMQYRLPSFLPKLY